MGFFDNLRSAVSMAKEGMAQANAAADAAEQERLNAPVTILNPTPQEQIDAGAQRAVVVKVIGQQLDPGERVHSMAVTLHVRARLAGGELGPATPVKVRMDSRAADGLLRG